MSERQATLEVKPIVTATAQSGRQNDESSVGSTWNSAVGPRRVWWWKRDLNGDRDSVTVTVRDSTRTCDIVQRWRPRVRASRSDIPRTLGHRRAPKTTSFSSNSSSDGDLTQAQFKKRVNFLQTITYANKAGAKVDIGGEGATATVVSTGVECPRVFDTQVEPSAGTGPILPGGKRKYVVGFSCAGKAGEQVLVAVWAADANTQGEDVSFVGTLP